MSRQDDFDALETYVAGDQGSFTAFSKDFSKDMPSAEVLARAECRLQNSRFFFSKSVKKSVKRGVRVLRARIFSVFPQSRSLSSASFQTFCLTARAYLNTQKYYTDCFAVYAKWDTLRTTVDSR